MVRRDPPPYTEPNDPQSGAIVQRRVVDFDIQQELARLQEMIYESFHIPLTRWTVIDEGKLLDHLEAIGESVPQAIRKALAVLEQEQTIMAESETYAQRIIQSAQQRAAQILDETGIVQQAQQEANQLRQQVQQECETIQRQTIAEIEQLRQVTAQEIQQYRQQTLSECQGLQGDAEEYANTVLTRLEQELSAMLEVVRNGRQQIYESSPGRNPSPTPTRASNPSKKRPPADRGRG